MPKSKENQTQSDTAQLLRNILAEELAPIRQELEEIRRKLGIVSETTPAEAPPKYETPPDDHFASARQTKHAAEFFRERGYFITDCQTAAPADVTYKLAKRLWGHVDIARPLLKRLYEEQETFSYPVSGLTPDEKNRLAGLCRIMAAESWLTFLTTKESFEITPQIPKQYRNFLNGGWAEAVNRYLIYKTLTEYSRHHDLNYRVLWNVCLKKIGSVQQNSCDMELDIVVDLKDRIYVFETKSGRVLGVNKWIDRARMFSGPRSRFITCCTDDTIDPKLFAPYKLFALPKLENQLSDLLRRDFGHDGESDVADKASPGGL